MAVDGGLGFPHSPQHIELMDQEPPFSRVRLVYESPRAAQAVYWHWKERMFTPRDLIRDDRFGGRALQVTPLTLEPMPTKGWLRSNPPKFRRLVPRAGVSVDELQQERDTTCYLVLHRLAEDTSWTEPGRVAEAIRSVVGSQAEVFCGKPLHQQCYVGLATPEEAQRVAAILQSGSVVWKYPNPDGSTVEVSSPGQVAVDFVAISDRSKAQAKARIQGHEEPRGEPTRPECTNETAHVDIPGLYLVEDFCSIAEEALLMSVLTGPHAPWAPAQATPTEGRTIRRKVQHYGYVFDYETADVLREEGKCPDIPGLPESVAGSLDDVAASSTVEGRGWELLAVVTERIRRTTFDNQQCYPDINQITVNHYMPGEGIGSHVDTPSAFGDGLLSLSLNGGTVTEFRRADDLTIRKQVYLPPRSLLLMSGPARYEWEHMIVTRRTDTHRGEVLKRGVRVSLTFRTALQLDGLPLPRLETLKFPPVPPSATFSTPACERDHVHAVYDAIATQWHHTRGRRGVLWPGATQFLQALPKGSLVADVGCGDGKYFPAIYEAGCYVIGSDMSIPLLETAVHAGRNQEVVAESRRVHESRQWLYQYPEVAGADCLRLPLRDKSCDAAICIAVLHHLSTPERRFQCFRELARVVVPGGCIHVQAWAMDQSDSSRRKFVTNDVLVPFNAQPKYLEDKQVDSFVNAEYDESKGLVVFQRYCHMYREGELDELVAQVPELVLEESGFESGNYYVIVRVM